MFWLIAAVMTGLAALAALWPLSRPRARADASSARFYSSQLEEIERDRARGALAPDEAAALRAETARRLLAEAGEAAPALEPATGVRARRRAAAALILVLVPAISLALYGRLGRPDLADEPLATRAPAPDGGLSVDATVAKLEAHLRAFPDDAKGFTLLAKTYMSLQRYDDAVHAFGEALRVKDDDANLRADYGEAQVAAAGGVVSASAAAAFARALKAKPELTKAQFYLALASEQEGDAPKAIAAFQAILDQTPQTSTLRDALAQRIAALKGEPPPPALTLRQRAEGMADQSPADQDKMIRGMVAGLATRLGQNGADAQGWQKLIRAYSVLKEADKAKDALERARKALASDATGLGQVEELAKQLGVGG